MALSNMSMVKCISSGYEFMGFYQGGIYLCIGEIVNMPGHYAIVNDKGLIISGIHDDAFILANSD